MTGNYAKKMIPEALRLWELSRMGIAAWAVAGSVGYVLCKPRMSRDTRVLHASLRT